MGNDGYTLCWYTIDWIDWIGNDGHIAMKRTVLCVIPNDDHWVNSKPENGLSNVFRVGDENDNYIKQ